MAEWHMVLLRFACRTGSNPAYVFFSSTHPTQSYQASQYIGTFFTLSSVCMHSTLYPQSQTDPYDLYLSISNRFWPVRALPDLLPTGGGLYQLVPARCAGAGPSTAASTLASARCPRRHGVVAITCVSEPTEISPIASVDRCDSSRPG